MPRYIVADRAQADIRQIMLFLRSQSVDAPKRVRQELHAAMRQLADFPDMGHRREDLTSEDLRFWPVYSYLIVYRPDRRPVEIARVLHGARDVGRELRRRRT